MLTIKSVTKESSDLDEVHSLYEKAFPENERRPFSELLNAPRSIAEIVALYDGELFCGFAVLLNVKDISHITYFAINEELRNRGYGSAALQTLHTYKSGQRILVDIEFEKPNAENNEQRRRRKQFYLRNGYEQTPIRYSWRHEDYEILAHGGIVTEAEYKNFWKQMR